MATFTTAEERLRSNPDVFDRTMNICSGYCQLECSIDAHTTLKHLFQIICVYFAELFDVFSIVDEVDHSSNEHRKVTHGGQRLYSSSYGEKEISDGKYVWKLRFNQTEGQMHSALIFGITSIETPTSIRFCSVNVKGDKALDTCQCIGLYLIKNGNLACRWPTGCVHIHRLKIDEEDRSVKFLEERVPFCCKGGDLICIRLDMNERTVSFDLNDEFVIRVRNLNPNASFRLAVTMRCSGDSVEILESFFE